MVNITYTQGQLEEFTVKELNNLDLFNRIGEVPKLNKADLIDLMMRFQKKEIADAKSTDESSKEEEIKTETETADADEEEDEDESSKEEEAIDEKPVVFHRKNNKGHRKSMGFM